MLYVTRFRRLQFRTSDFVIIDHAICALFTFNVNIIHHYDRRIENERSQRDQTSKYGYAFTSSAFLSWKRNVF